MMSLLPLVCLLAMPLAAQVPDGWAVVASTKQTAVPTPANPFPGDGGLFIVHPRQPGVATPITGLGSDLTGAGQAGGTGAGCVAIRPSDAALIVGETAGPNDQVDLHVISLNGTAVFGDMPFALGTGVAGSSVTQVALVSDDCALVAVTGIDAGPLANADLGTVDLVTGAVTPLLAAGLLGNIANAIVVDPSGTIAWVGVFGPSAGQVYRVPIAQPSNATLLATLPTGVLNLALESDGQLLAGVLGSGGFGLVDNLFRIDPASGIATPLNNAASVGNAVAIETVTGTAMFVEQTFLPPQYFLTRGFGGGRVILSQGPVGGWGQINGIAVARSPQTYGDEGGVPGQFTWALSPNPGGLPEVGNTAFSLSVETAPSSQALVSFVGVSCLAAQPAVQLAGFLLNIDPATLIFSTAISTSQLATLPLPIPSSPGLSGATVFVQSVHVDASNALASSRGLRLTIL